MAHYHPTLLILFIAACISMLESLPAALHFGFFQQAL